MTKIQWCKPPGTFRDRLSYKLIFEKTLVKSSKSHKDDKEFNVELG